MAYLSRRSLFAAALSAGLLQASGLLAADKPREIRLDWATYNPVSMVLKDKGWLEKEFAKENISIRWVQTLGSNKALEFLNAGSIDFGSTAGSAALVARINGNPIKSIYVYSRPEWTALVVRKDSPIGKVADLKGKRVAVTRGTDPHIFLVRALLDTSLSEKDISPVLLQHPDGKTALIRGDVDAWAGLDPMMAQAEVEDGARLFFRKPDANTWGILNVREDFLKDHPDLVRRVLAVYEEARSCRRCPLHQTRTNVVFGAGNADADLMFIGEAPGANEDRMGLPFVGQAGKLLDKLLAEIETAKTKKGRLNRTDTAVAGNTGPKAPGAGEAALLVGNLPWAERHLAALEQICLLPCEELDDLRAAISAYRERKGPGAPGPPEK